MQIESRRSEGAGLQQSQVGKHGDPVFLAAGSAAEGEFHCADCGYGISVRALLPECPMCRGRAWEEPATSPYGRPRR